MKGKIATIFVMTLMIAPILTAAASENEKPDTPIIEGPSTAEIGETCFYNVISTDPQGDDLYYEVRYSDDPSINIIGGPFKSGDKITFAHCWDDFYQDYNPFVIKVRAVDEQDHKSDWGEFEVKVTNAKVGVCNLLLQFLENHPNVITLILKIIRPR
jgi:hypothetical protein